MWWYGTCLPPWHSEGRGGKLRCSRLACAAQDFVSNKTKQKKGKQVMYHTLYSKEALGRVSGGTVIPSAAGQNPTALNNKPCCTLGSLALSEGMPLPKWLSPFQTLPRSISHRQINLSLSCIHRPWISHGEGDHHLGKLQNRDGLTLPLK